MSGKQPLRWTNCEGVYWPLARTKQVWTRQLMETGGGTNAGACGRASEEPKGWMRCRGNEV